MKKVFSKIDKPLLFSFIILLALGIVMVYSSSSISSVLRYDKPSYYFFEKQLFFVLLAFFISIFIIKIPLKYHKIIAYLGLVVCFILLVGLLIKNTLTNNAASWYRIGNVVSLQPSEFVKSFSILSMAFFYGRYFSRKNPTFVGALIPLVIYLIIAGLIIKQPDMGSAVIFLGIIGAIFISLPFKEKYIKTVKIVIFTIAAIGFYILLFHSNILTGTQESRFNYKNPCSRYTLETGYQVCNGFIAINNGGLFGLGLGNSTQKYLYLPESHTDFIYPIICEELGLVVGLFVLLLYGLMLIRIYNISKRCTNLRNQIICYGTFIYLALHILINLVGITALLPLTGVPLPLLSYGGSFILNVICMITYVEKICYDTNCEKNKQKLLEI